MVCVQEDGDEELGQGQTEETTERGGIGEGLQGMGGGR